jgi:hypothetical protein
MSPDELYYHFVFDGYVLGQHRIEVGFAGQIVYEHLLRWGTQRRDRPSANALLR